MTLKTKIRTATVTATTPTVATDAKTTDKFSWVIGSSKGNIIDGDLVQSVNISSTTHKEIDWDNVTNAYINGLDGHTYIGVVVSEAVKTTKSGQNIQNFYGVLDLLDKSSVKIYGFIMAEDNYAEMLDDNCLALRIPDNGRVALNEKAAYMTQRIVK